MKDIDELLQSTEKSTPKRLVSASFTNDVINRINIKEEKSTMFMKLRMKPVGVVLAVVVVLASGATAYAAVSNWPSIVSVFGGQQSLDSGARIVKIETEGCTPVDGSIDTTKRVSYYEIKKDSALTNERAVAMMQGICEEELPQKWVGDFYHETGVGVTSTSIEKIEKIDADSITLAPNRSFGTASKTYTNIATNVQVRSGSADIRYSDLKPGDSIVIGYVDERGVSTEMRGYTEDLSKLQVRVIFKAPPLTGSPELFYKYLGKDFVRVEPSKDGKGFTRAYDFEENYKQ